MVAGSPDAMPPIRLYEGELIFIFSMIKRLTDKVDEYSTVLSAVTRGLQLLHARCATQMPKCDQPQRQSMERSSAVVDITTVQPSMSNVPDWAAIASTPSVHANTFDTLRFNDDGEQSDALGQTDSYTVVQTRRGKRRARILFGKSSNTDVKISAAKQIRKKAVFCIDNVSTDCSVDDIKSFVSGLSVQMLTCFQVKPRRRRGDDDDDIKDRNAFRLCIYDDDRSQLLDESAWPDSVSVSEWFFKPPQRVQQEQQVDKRRRVAVDDQRASSAAGASTSSIVDNADTNLQTTVSDDTIIIMESLNTVAVDNGGAAR